MMAGMSPHSLYYDKVAASSYFSPAADYLRVVGGTAAGHSTGSDMMSAQYSLFPHAAHSGGTGVSATASLPHQPLISPSDESSSLVNSSNNISSLKDDKQPPSASERMFIHVILL